MTAYRHARDYEDHLGDGYIRIFEGHPCWCPIQEKHEYHQFTYTYRDVRGGIWQGSYLCDGVPFDFAKRDKTPAFDIRSDGITVWVDNSRGFTIARFGTLGIDIHNADATGCLHCTHGHTTDEDWDIFKDKMLKHYNVVIGDEYKPARFN